jgi:cyclohexanone monooxygenase
MHSRGFPNCFIISTTQSGFSVNFPHMLNEQAKHISYIVKHAQDHELRAVEVSEEAERAWVETIISLARGGREFQEACTPGYYNNEGKPAELSGQNGWYGGGPIAFVKLLEDGRADGHRPGMELRYRDTVRHDDWRIRTSNDRRAKPREARRSHLHADTRRRSPCLG